MGSEVATTREQNWNADTAWACTVYSMVPYLGVLFVPFALAFSGLGFVRARRRSSSDGPRFLLCAGVSSLILAIQLMLWSLLYLIPKIGI
ncbi:MAG: hypothetical protein ABIO91_03445 [Pyrinomonadaceae bacterium]